MTVFFCSSLWHKATFWMITQYIWEIQGTETRGIKKECFKDGSHSSSSFQIFLLCALWHPPLRAYDQVVALTSIRQGEIKHATVRRHTRRIQLQLLTCDIKKGASIRHRDKGDPSSEREGRDIGAGCNVRRNYSLSTSYNYSRLIGKWDKMLQWLHRKSLWTSVPAFGNMENGKKDVIFTRKNTCQM